jgi:hypothetical protein
MLCSLVSKFNATPCPHCCGDSIDQQQPHLWDSRIHQWLIRLSLRSYKNINQGGSYVVRTAKKWHAILANFPPPNASLHAFQSAIEARNRPSAKGSHAFGQGSARLDCFDCAEARRQQQSSVEQRRTMTALGGGNLTGSSMRVYWWSHMETRAIASTIESKR